MRHLAPSAAAQHHYMSTRRDGAVAADFSRFDDGSVLTVNTGLPYIPAQRHAAPPSGRDGAPPEASHFHSEQASDQLSEAICFDLV